MTIPVQPQSIALALIQSILGLPFNEHANLFVHNPFVGQPDTAGDAHKVLLRLDLQAQVQPDPIPYGQGRTTLADGTLHQPQISPPGITKHLYFYGDDLLSFVQSQIAAAEALFPAMIAGMPDETAMTTLDGAHPNFPVVETGFYAPAGTVAPQVRVAV